MRPVRYLRDVKEKENKTWTDADKMEVHSLCQRLSAAKVASLFGTTIVSIYNIKRVTKKGLSNNCFRCGQPLTKKEISEKKSLIGACHKCKMTHYKYKKARRKTALKQGMCGYCEVRPVLPGHTACKKCISATYRRRIKQNLCGICGKKPIKKEALCADCITKSTNHRKEQYATN